MTGRHTFTPEDGAFPAAAYPFPEIPMLTSSQKVFDVLEFLCANGPHKALEVSKALSLQKSSVHRFLNSLIEFGYVRKDDQTGLFSVTLKVVQLGAMVSSKIDMVETGRSYMRELVATFDQATVSFATFMDKQVLVLRIPPQLRHAHRSEPAAPRLLHGARQGSPLDEKRRGNRRIHRHRPADGLHPAYPDGRGAPQARPARRQGKGIRRGHLRNQRLAPLRRRAHPHPARRALGHQPFGALFRHPRVRCGKHREASEKGRLGYDLRLFRRARRLTRRFARAPGKAPAALPRGIRAPAMPLPEAPPGMG